jgi:glycosyl transferase family 25
MIWPFAHACVINLDSRKDRWARIQAHLHGLGLQAERFSAVSMHRLDEDPPSPQLREFLLRVDGDSDRFEHKLRATWACMRSHLAVIAMAKDRGWPQVLVLEDDCEFEPYAPAVLRRVPAQLLSRDWTMLYLGGTLKKGGQARKVSANLVAVNRVRLAHAYVVKADLYDRILQEAPLSGLPLDWYYSENLLPTTRAFLVRPLLARQSLMVMSDIEQVVRKPKLKTRQLLGRLAARLRYGLLG